MALSKIHSFSFLLLDPIHIIIKSQAHITCHLYRSTISYVQTAPDRRRLLIIDDKSLLQNIDERPHGC